LSTPQGTPRIVPTSMPAPLESSARPGLKPKVYRPAPAPATVWCKLLSTPHRSAGDATQQPPRSPRISRLQVQPPGRLLAMPALPLALSFSVVVSPDRALAGSDQSV